MIDINKLSISNKSIYFDLSRLKNVFPINENINVIPAFDLFINYNNCKYNEMYKKVNNMIPAEVNNEDYKFHLSKVFERKNEEISFNLFYSYSLAKKATLSSVSRSMKYDILRRVFNGYFQVVDGRSFRSPSVDRNILALPGIVYDINQSSGNVKILYCIVIKKEWIPDVLMRTSLDLKLNPNSFGLLYDPSFDHKDYHYKGLRSYFRKNIKPSFEEEDIIIPQENIADLFKREVKTPSFLIEKEKEEWCEQLLDDFYFEMNN